ncbi:MAG TPA: hypothetical protein VHD90_01205 [Phototrophicaceae bacterium]|nr:hypothetical protein [Phototrophicaceae bacterium]
MRWIFALMVLVLLAACRPATNNQAADPNIVQWDRNPQTILFRADVIGGETDFMTRNDIPNCTIFGDNRIVWVNELGPFQIQVLEDRLSDATISGFIQHLAVDDRIYTYDAHLADIQKQSNANPVTETITLNVDGIEHQADSFSGWNSDFFPNVLQDCKNLAQAPVLVAPSTGWISAQTIPFNMQPPLVVWDAQQTGISLNTVASAGSPVWMTGQGVTTLWNELHSLPTTTIFEDDKNYFQVALQVPGVTRNAPLAPGS